MTTSYLLRLLNSSIKNYHCPAQHSFDGTLLLVGDRLSWVQSGCGDRTTRDRCAIRARGYMPRCTWTYRRVVLASRPLAIALLTTAWMMERMFNFKVLPN